MRELFIFTHDVEEHRMQLSKLDIKEIGLPNTFMRKKAIFIGNPFAINQFDFSFTNSENPLTKKHRKCF